MHDILSHLVDKIGRVEKQNLEIICQLEHLQRRGRDTGEKENGKEHAMGSHEKRRYPRLEYEAHSSKKAQKEVNNQDMVGRLFYIECE